MDPELITFLFVTYLFKDCRIYSVFHSVVSKEHLTGLCPSVWRALHSRSCSHLSVVLWKCSAVSLENGWSQF